MPKLTIDEIKKMRASEKKRITMREGDFRGKITVHLGTCGIAAGARDIMAAFADLMIEKDITDIMFTSSGCAGLCSMEPMATVEIGDSPPVKYGELTPEKVAVILDKHITRGQAVTELAIGMGSERIG